jgi:hypothetical protein
MMSIIAVMMGAPLVWLASGGVLQDQPDMRKGQPATSRA